KAAFEGQALRALINGLQARTKYRLSDVTKHFAERCYERRLFFYFCEALRLCIQTQSGMERAGEILDSTDSCDLQNVWQNLFDHCQETLRENSMEASTIRLSKLSVLWNQRSGHSWLLKLVFDMVRCWIDNADYMDNRFTDTIRWIVDNPKKVSVVENGGPPIDLLKRAIAEKESEIVIMEDTAELIECVVAHVSIFVQASVGDILHVVCEKKETIDSIMKELDSHEIKYDLKTDGYSPRNDFPKVILTSLQYINTHSGEYYNISKLGTVLFVGHESQALALPSTKIELNSDEDKISINDLLVEIHIWGNILIHQMKEIESRFQENPIQQQLDELVKSWPKSMQDCISKDSLWNVVIKKDPPFLRTRLDKFEEQKILECARTIWSSKCLTSNSEDYPKIFVDCFLYSKKLTIDVHYSIIIEETRCFGPIHRVRLEPHVANDHKWKHYAHYIKNFLELSHGCELTDQSSADHTYYSTLEKCTSYVSIMVSSEFTTRNIQIDGRTPFTCSSIVNNASERREGWRDTMIMNLFGMINLLCIPFGPSERSPRDIRCDRFVELALFALESIEHQIGEIDLHLKQCNFTGWPELKIPNYIINVIARTHNVDGIKLCNLANDWLSRENTTRSLDLLMEEIRKKLERDDDMHMKWKTLVRNGRLQEYEEVCALSPDAVSDATHLLQHLRLVEFNPDQQYACQN
ncbi:hypothetical protein PENTCL1PPCAC_5877, partial [Pristionchus entomophagus]